VTQPAWWILPALIMVACGAWPGSAQAQATKPKAPTSDDCLMCHGESDAKRADGRPVFVPATGFAASVHGQAGFSCVDCHADLATAELPHAEKVAPVDCATCHAGPVATYQTGVHAEARRAANAAAATCTDCHGTHDIRPSKDPDSPTYHLNLPRTCGRCHGNPEIIRQGKIAIGNVYAQFQDSIHGRALSRAGLLVAPNCSDCHGAHDIKRRINPESHVFRTVVPATCGKCHQGVERLYMGGIHGTSLAKGNPLVPECATCHSAHQIQRVESESWRLQVIRECGTCHVESIRTYRDTLHGQVTSLGFVRVAKCADCHGAHDILPQSDPGSRVAPARLVSTCQKCHPAATLSFARYDPHADRHNRQRNPFLFLAARFMDTLLIGVFAFFSLHTALWFSRTAKPRLPGARKPPTPPSTPAEAVTEKPDGPRPRD
jgi:hypothetical protein